ncbi:HAD family hydrolase [bacterium]|nr:HAD family hydrolase [bacterium]
MEFKTVLLDCDGVILDSNQIKTDAFRAAVGEYSEGRIQALVDYHRLRGGISRFDKIKYFLTDLVGSYSEQEYNNLIERFEQSVVKQLQQSEFTEGALRFLQLFYTKIDLFVVSGGFQQELRDVFSHKGASLYFKDILGSPTAKTLHVSNLLNVQKIQGPVLFVGDSIIDHQVAVENGVEFIFLSDYTDYDDWRNYCGKNTIENYPNFTTLMEKRGWL